MNKRLPAELAQAYDRMELQQCALLPVELARAANGYIDSTEPFKLAKDPALAGRLETVLNIAARSVHAALVGLLPILPEKSVAGLKQLAVDAAGKTGNAIYRSVPTRGQNSVQANRFFRMLSLCNSDKKRFHHGDTESTEDKKNQRISHRWGTDKHRLKRIKSIVFIGANRCPIGG